MRHDGLGQGWTRAGRRGAVLAALCLVALLGAVAPAPAAAADTDLAIASITERSDPVTFGDSIRYIVTVRNLGPAPDEATVTFDVPANTTFASASASKGSCSGAVAGTVTCSLGTVASPNGTATVTVFLEPQAPGSVSFSARVAGTGADPNTSNNTGTASTTVNPRPTNLGLTLSGPATAAVGEPLTYTATITNNDRLPADGLALSVPAPAGLAFTTAGACSTTPAGATCAIGTLAAGATVTVTLTAQASVADRYTVTATLTDGNGGSRAASAATKVAGPPTDVAVSIAGSPNPALEAGTVTYTITVANRGPNQADGVVLTALLPAGMTLEAVSADVGLCTPATAKVDCTLGTIPASGSLVVTVKANAGGTGDFTVSAAVDSAATDPDTTNNAAATTTTVVPRVADLSVVINDPGPVLVNDSFTLVVNMFNPNVATAENVSLDITVPAGVSVLAVTTNGTCATLGSTLSCLLGRLNGGAARGLQLRLRAPAPGPLTFSATIRSATPDPNPANNAASGTVSVVTELPAPPSGGGSSGGGGGTGGGTPPPASTAVGLTAGLDGRSARLSKGLPVAVSVTGEATVRFSLSAKVKGRTRRLGSWRKGFKAAGEATVRLKLSRAARRTAGRLRTGSTLTLTVTATGADGKATTERVRLKLSRGGRVRPPAA